MASVGDLSAAPRFVDREAVAGTCMECGAEALSRYPVLAEGGWYDAVKCGACLASHERTPGPLFGPVRRLFPVPGRSPPHP